MSRIQRRRAPIDELSDLTRSIVGCNVVLARFFDLHANAAHKDSTLIDFGGYREVDFWYGLRALMDATVADADRVAELAGVIVEKADT